MDKKLLVAIIIVMLILLSIVVLYMLGIFSRRPAETTRQEVSRGDLTVEVLEAKRGEVLRIPIGKVGDQTLYIFYHREDGYVYLVRLRISNEGTQTYTVDIRLITDKDQYHIFRGCRIESPRPSTPEYQSLNARAIEVSRDVDVYGYDITAILGISPGARKELYVFYCPRSGETPQKLHIIAGSPTGRIIELSVPLRS